MKLQTTIPVSPWASSIHYGNQVLLMGSCFTENIGTRLQEAGFNALLNPQGITFNPVSICQSIHDLIEKRPIDSSELVERDGLWHHWAFHSSLSGIDRVEVAERMTAAITDGHHRLRQASHLMITLGTSWVYALKENGVVVNNCHKFPADHFERRRLAVEEVTAAFDEVLEQLEQFNPELQIVFTLSPVRHWKDGAEGNSVSKATLRIAIDELCTAYALCDYFPAYEIMMDELRDYRFYADDLLHPNTIAQVIIWERFVQTALTKVDHEIAREVQAYHRMLAHRSLHPGSVADQTFKESIEERRKDLLERYPQIHLA